MTKETSPIPIDAVADPGKAEAVASNVRKPVIEDDIQGLDPDNAKYKHKKHTPDSSYQNYLFGNAGTDERPAWSDSMKGRAAIRLISRGIVGAAFFTIGGRMAHDQLKGYNQHTWQWDRSKPLQAIAKGFDVTLGRGIESSIRLFAKMAGRTAEEAQAIATKSVSFRSTRHYEGSGYDLGRSYGSEVVGFTFDFAMASIGDALTRNLIQAFDPNIRKSWHVNDRGEVASVGEKYHTDFGKLAKHIGATGWLILSKNQGEDWAAAIPYAFQMKFQRQFLSNVLGKRFDGHKIAFDHGWNGGAYKVNSAGQVVGDYQLAGAIDLHARFVGYNWYTLMFREGYDTISNAFTKWKENGFGLQPLMPQQHSNPLMATVDGIGASLRYATKSFIKANMYMNPAVIPFWVMRVPQSKWRAGSVMVDHNMPPIAVGDNKQPVSDFHNAAHYDAFPTQTRMDRFEKGFSKFFNPVGQFSYEAGMHVSSGAKKLADKGYAPKIFGDQKFMREYVDASLSYTPYMWAKAETALRVDDSKGDGKPGMMDTAIYRFIDDVTSFNFRGIPADIKKMWKLGTNFEREIKVREGSDATQQIVQMKPQPKPENVVEASSVAHHQPATFVRGEAANEPDHAGDKRWAQAVVGGDYNAAQFHPGSASRH